MSEAASMEGDLSDEDNLKLLDAGDGQINLIEIENGIPKTVTCTVGSDTITTSPLIPLPQRLNPRNTRGTPKSGPSAQKKICNFYHHFRS